MDSLTLTAQAAPQAAVIPRHTKVIVFCFCFLGLLADGADLMLLSYSLGSLRQEFGLTPFQAGSLGSITLAAMAIGGLYGGWACDRFGRAKVVFWTLIIFSLGTATLGLTHNYWQFAAVRFLSSLGLGSLFVASNTLMSEFVSTRYRTTVLATLQAGWTVGYLVATVLAGAIIPGHGWRWLFFVAVLPVTLALFAKPLVPEPPAWLAAHAEKNRLRRSGEAAAVKRQDALRVLLGDPAARRMLLLWTLTAGLMQFGYYGTNNWMPSYLEGELHMNFKAMTGYMVGTYAAMIFGKVFSGMAADRFGRRATFVFGALGTAIFLPAIVYLHSAGNILYLLVAFGFLYGIPVGVVATYMTESFDTRVRGSGVGGAYNGGRVIAAFAPAIIGVLASEVSIGMGFVVMGAAYLLCGVIPALWIRDKLHDPQKGS
ncbi:MFS transporter [Pseudomonas typographi]|uniref:MFS transporter n=1 Tax=Pseudomonas typographi TaxID=2715964 RepID=A0ABR7Z1K8_9PSED|nr:MFS transporter [Pseudomonas typographi]MBD1587547.1 MFS transporter [Pseudomonas typographi]MBD1599370.1 MFS transporter [Pseudomonas typographi]